MRKWKFGVFKRALGYLLPYALKGESEKWRKFCSFVFVVLWKPPEYLMPSSCFYGENHFLSLVVLWRALEHAVSSSISISQTLPNERPTTRRRLSSSSIETRISRLGHSQPPALQWHPKRNGGRCATQDLVRHVIVNTSIPVITYVLWQYITLQMAFDLKDLSYWTHFLDIT